MKTIKTLAVLLASLLCVQGIAQNQSSDKKEKKKNKKKSEASTQTWLWEISGNGLKQPSYLYGTIHILCPMDFKMSDSLKSKLDKSQQLVLEVVDADNPMNMLTVMQAMMMKNGRKLKDLYTEEEYTEIRKFFNDSIGLDISTYGMMSPMFFMVATLPSMIGCEMPKSYEAELTKLAREQNKDVKQVETLEGQLNLFDTIPEHIQAQELLRTVREWNKEKQTFDGLVQMYKEQDFEKSLAFMHAHMGNMVEYKDVLLDKRNQEWITKIKAMAAEKPTLFAFGAGHLGGEKGLVELLKKEGYTLTPVKNELE